MRKKLVCWRVRLVVGVVVVVAVSVGANAQNAGGFGNGSKVDGEGVRTAPVCEGCVQIPAPLSIAAPAGPKSVSSKWDLWRYGTALRGANIWQAALYADPAHMQYARMETHYAVADFAKLRRWGANYVNISHAGIFSEKKVPGTPKSKEEYGLVDPILVNLKDLVSKCAENGLFVVVSFRTGPGRNERVFGPDNFSGERLTTLFETNADGALTQQARDAQAAWIAMWKQTASELKGQANVAGYDLMVEPVTKFERDGTGYKQQLWLDLALRIARAIRLDAGDKETPILIGGTNYSSACALSCVDTTLFSTVGKVVFTAHQYEPYVYYTQQANRLSLYDCKDGQPSLLPAGSVHGSQAFDDKVRETLDVRFDFINGFKQRYSAPVAVNEYGVTRWAGTETDADAGRFLKYEMDLLDRLGANNAIWLWQVSDCLNYDDMNVQHGTDPKNHVNVPAEKEAGDRLIAIIKGYWSRNRIFAAAGKTGASDRGAKPWPRQKASERE